MSKNVYVGVGVCVRGKVCKCKWYSVSGIV